jgi:ketosteroid isomerase-like protein
MSNHESDSAVNRFLDAVVGASMAEDLFTEDASLDATVPNWRFSVVGPAAIAEQLREWYADPGEFTELRRESTPSGEVVEFFLNWREDGVPFACHQAHVLTVRDGKIAADVAFCGGRWPEPLLVEMRRSEQERAAAR